MAEYVNPDVLVETDWLEQNLGGDDIVVIEVDEDTTAYEKGHIPGAVMLNWESDLHDLPRRDFVSAEQLGKLLGERGVGNEKTIVLYGGNNNWFAAYAYWLFKLRGVDNVKLLNGGRKKWELESRTFAQDEPDVSATDYSLGSEKTELRAHRDEVLSAVRDGEHAYVDVRSPEEFRGELVAPPHLPQEQAQVPGHIPGASNIPWAKAVNEDGTFKSADELTELYANEGVDGSKPTIAYCRIGERAAHSWFVLHELLGYENTRNYDGSWTEYGSLVGVPVEK